LLEASLANLALSERLTDYPQRFISAGYQSAMDIVALMKQIQTGMHPLFNAGAQVDIFAYSISCMVIQALMVSNPARILDNSRIVFFAGGCLFNRMNGISRYIMDNIAFRSIQNYDAERSRTNVPISDNDETALTDREILRAFFALTEEGSIQADREKKFAQYSERLMIIALQEDKVIPVRAVADAFGTQISSSNRFKVVQFPYVYSHENPFPMLNRNIEALVENSFKKVFEPVGRFIGETPAHLNLGRRKVDYETAAGAG